MAEERQVVGLVVAAEGEQVALEVQEAQQLLRRGRSVPEAR